jgi:hypothetical protein
MQQRQLPLPPHKRTPGPEATPCDARIPPHDPLHGVNLHGRRLPVHGERLAGGDFNLGVDQGHCRGAQQDGPGGRLLLQAHGQVERLSDRREELLWVIPEPPNYHTARVQPYPDGQDSP